MKKLPVGISNLREIIENGYAYVDKSIFVHDLEETGKYYFLSRPRRFGKSLMVDTLKEAFEGNRRLFQELWLENKRDWEQVYPVIRVSFGQGIIGSRSELEEKIAEILYFYEQKFGVVSDFKSISGRFAQLIESVSMKYNQRVVLLVDEYDKPILDNIIHRDRVEEIRDGLKNFYSVIKDSDAHLHFVFITGVSKFSKVSLFSGLNNLVDITLSPMFATICGLTESELVCVFEEHLKGQNLDDIRRWYNGYSWLGKKVYNPFSILNFFREGLFRNYWFESGTPAFLLQLLMERHYPIPGIEKLEVGAELLGSFELDNIFVETLLFQTGYLTITAHEEVLPGEVLYRLNYPNFEVKKSFTEYLLTCFTQQPAEMKKSIRTVIQCLRHGQPDALKEVFYSFFAAILHDWYRKNSMAAYEGYYCSVFYCYFSALGLEVRAEDVSSHGNMDMTVLFEGKAYIFEFKMSDHASGKALSQIKNKGYAKKYMADSEAVYLIAVAFSRDERNISGFEWELAQ
ncbi:PD-(D/E)XK nuclease superfamily protein [Desulfobotulus alkaliphilus]|uniref:PD-(D/E)XK nuclease superfamily protein n=2 Tax=Desulfobotulus alkaliphilus TaxID=622671 RepID=A0A562RYP6_9BACT|nr:PD-(D/E)XK nuclease superfamily protein [Desulfobotulus alkaliphilus]